jgi:hypothetical protein
MSIMARYVHLWRGSLDVRRGVERTGSKPGLDNKPMQWGNL